MNLRLINLSCLIKGQFAGCISALSPALHETGLRSGSSYAGEKESCKYKVLIEVMADEWWRLC